MFTNYTSVPAREIDQSIAWLQSVADDCNYKIDRLRRIKRDRQRALEWRQKWEKLARDFARDEFLSIPEDKQLEIIKQRHGGSMDDCKRVLENAKRYGLQKKKNAQYVRIAKLYDAGFSPSEISNDETIEINTRQGINRVINKHKEKPFY